MDDDGAYGTLDEALARPPQLLGCERTPFLVMVGTAASVTVTAFGITLTGLVAGVILVAAGLMVLRRVAAHDPFYFAVVAEAARYPRRMPDVLPDPVLPRHLPFVGYDDPPSRETVLLARALLAVAALATVAGAVALAVALSA